MSEVNFILFFFFDSDWVKLIWVIFCRWNLSKIFCNQVGYMLFIWGYCVSFREVIYWLLIFLFVIFFIKSQILVGICIRIYLWNEGSPWGSFCFFEVFAFFCLYLFRFSDERFVLNFLRVAWGSLMFLHSSVNHDLCFGDIVVLGIVLFAMLMRVIIKCIMCFSGFVFDSEISVVRQSFFVGFPICSFEVPSWRFYLWFWFFLLWSLLRSSHCCRRLWLCLHS